MNTAAQALPTGEEIIRRIREKTDTILLSFSCGKDSVAAWLACRPHFKIIPYYLWIIPDLDFVNKALEYFENFFNTKIIRLPHPSAARLLNNLVFQAPENCAIIENAGIPNIDYDFQAQEAARIAGIELPAWAAIGVRTADSPNRRTALRKYGCINEKSHKFYPVHDWNKERLLAALKESRVKLPIDYQLFGRSFDGIDYRFLKPIRDRLPDDYAKIIKAFPLCELEIKRREFHERHIRARQMPIPA